MDLPEALLDSRYGPFSGVIGVRRGGTTAFQRCVGYADRAHRVPVALDTQFGIASVTKAFTAVVLGTLIRDGTVRLDTTARSVLGTDLPLIAADVTVEHLLTHRSGIGDYVDEDLDPIPPLRVPVQQLDSTEAYLPALDGFATKFPAGERFSYCNSGYVVLALIAERVGGRSFAELVADRVTEPAGMPDTAFLRSDALPGRAAVGYLASGQTNVFSLPVVGSGDGGAYSTVTDLQSFWDALLGGALVPDEWVRRMATPVSVPGRRAGYGLGLWADADQLYLDGGDLGVAVRSVYVRRTGDCVTVLANAECGIIAIVNHLLAQL